jgi:hypothetical protein
MARSAKGARNIIVNEVAYRWRAAARDNRTSVVIWPGDPDLHPGGELTGAFMHTPDAPWLHIVITNRMVRRIILHAIEVHHYNPNSSRLLALGRLDEVFDIADELGT